MLRILRLFVLAAVAQCLSVAAFQPSSPCIQQSSVLELTRREVFEAGTHSSMANILALTTAFVTISPKQVLASGGATAGGAYLLSVRLSCNGIYSMTHRDRIPDASVFVSP